MKSALSILAWFGFGVAAASLVFAALFFDLGESSGRDILDSLMFVLTFILTVVLVVIAVKTYGRYVDSQRQGGGNE